MFKKDQADMDSARAGVMATTLFALLIILGAGLVPVSSQADFSPSAIAQDCARETGHSTAEGCYP